MCPGVSSNLNGISRRKTEDTNISADKWRIYQQNINTEQENNSLTFDIMVIYGIHLYLQKFAFAGLLDKNIHDLEKYFHGT